MDTTYIDNVKVLGEKDLGNSTGSILYRKPHLWWVLLWGLISVLSTKRWGKDLSAGQVEYYFFMISKSLGDSIHSVQK